MNEIQKAYVVAKAAYDTAFQAEDWVLVDNLEDTYLEAEIALYDWMADVVVATGKMSREDTDLMRRNSNTEQWNKMIDMALRLQA